VREEKSSKELFSQKSSFLKRASLKSFSKELFLKRSDALWAGGWGGSGREGRGDAGKL
jgi:hypothetical protein